MISVCIPTYEQAGFGAKYLAALLDSLVSQCEAEFEVVVSDNSRDNAIQQLCASYLDRLKLRYIRNNETFGISNNSNNAIARAESDLIKIMYQDDLLYSPYALRRFEKALGRAHWVVASYTSMDERGQLRRTHHPSWSDDILFGDNTIGMPSVMATRRNEFHFDTQLRTRLDCDYYWLLHRKYGAPEFIREPLVAVRYWNGSASRVQGNLTQRERPYLIAKHGVEPARPRASPARRAPFGVIYAARR